MCLDIVSYILGKKKGGGGSVTLQTKSVTVTSNGSQNITADTGYDGLKKVELTTNVSADLSDYFTSTLNGRAYKMLKTIPDDTIVASIDLSSAFAECSGLITIPLLDTSNVQFMNKMFYNCTSLTSIPLLDTSHVENMSSMFYNCTSLTSIPLLDTSYLSPTNMVNMFSGCTSLTTVPLLSTSQITSFSKTFENCPNLTDTSLDNILQMCINSDTTMTNRKNLVFVGFSESNYPASRIQALPHYQDFIDAGWTIGY